MNDLTPGDVIRAARLERGLRQRDLEAMTGIPQSTIGTIERNIHAPTFDAVMSLCNVLNLDPWQVWGRTPKRGMTPNIAKGLALEYVERMLRMARDELREAAW